MQSIVVEQICEIEKINIHGLNSLRNDFVKLNYSPDILDFIEQTDSDKAIEILQKLDLPFLKVKSVCMLRHQHH